MRPGRPRAQNPSGLPHMWVMSTRLGTARGLRRACFRDMAVPSSIMSLNTWMAELQDLCNKHVFIVESQVNRKLLSIIHNVHCMEYPKNLIKIGLRVYSMCMCLCVRTTAYMGVFVCSLVEQKYSMYSVYDRCVCVFERSFLSDITEITLNIVFTENTTHELSWCSTY